MDILIYLLYHDEGSYAVIEKYKNYKYVKLIHIQTTKYFESIFFDYLNENQNEWENKDYVGILTYSFETKTGMKLDYLYNFILDYTTHNNVELFSFYTLGKMSYFLYSHRDIITYTLAEMNYNNVEFDKIIGFFCNYWLTKPQWMKKYITFHSQVKSKFEDKSNVFLQNMLNSNSGYHKLTPEQLQARIGYSYYPHHCFVMERLPSIFFQLNNLKLKSQIGFIGIFV